ncbi:MAG: DNA polymerase Y family protein [Pseudomonadota bacterium]
MSLWLCLRFEQLPLQCLHRGEEQPVIVASAQRVLRANDCAAALGIRQGMGVATVRTLAAEESVLLLERDENAEQRCLQQLCCWAYSITPALHSWRQDSLLLEIGGCLALFQGLQTLLEDVSRGISQRGFRAQLGLAVTPKAAWLLSHTEEDTAMAIEQPLEERLAPLPLQLLTDFSGTVDSLRRAGLHTLGDILALPASALGRRCGRAFTDFMQQLLGQREDLQADYQPPATFNDEYWFGYEVKTNDELLPAVQQLLKSLCRFLRNTQLQTGEIHWQLIGVDGRLRTVCVRSGSAHSHWQDWYRLSALRFEQLALETSVEGLALACDQLSPGQQDSIDLFRPHLQREPLAALLDRLRNRLGLQAVEQVSCRDEHLPELALHVSSEIGSEQSQTDTPGTQRPFWLLPQPRLLLQQRGQLYWSGALQLIYGPERIEDNWWREPVSRDYYIASDDKGQHYWVFRDRLARQWYLQGIFA